MPMDTIPGAVNYFVTVKGTKLKPNDLINVINKAEELGLKQPGGISREHLLNARNKTEKGSETYNTLDELYNKFGKFDMNNNDVLDHGDIPGIVDENLKDVPDWIKEKFNITRENAISRGESLLESEFGVDKSKVPKAKKLPFSPHVPGSGTDETGSDSPDLQKLEHERKALQYYRDQERLRKYKDENKRRDDYLPPRNIKELEERELLDSLRRRGA